MHQYIRFCELYVFFVSQSVLTHIVQIGHLKAAIKLAASTAPPGGCASIAAWSSQLDHNLEMPRDRTSSQLDYNLEILDNPVRLRQQLTD